MADVTAGPGASGADDPEGSSHPGADAAGARDRAQLLLVAGLVIAVTFVVLALTLNTVIYTENLATRSSDIAGGDDSIRFLESSEDGVAGILDRANRNHNESHAALRENVSAGVDAWRNTTGRSFAVDGIVTNVSGLTVTDGTRMLQTDGSRNFTAADGSANWTLASDVSGTRQFRLNVTNASLTDAEQATIEAEPVFHVDFNGPSDSRWKVFVYSNLSGTNTVEVTVKNQTAPTNWTKLAPCSATGEHAFVNITGGTVGGEPCSALSFVSGLQSPYEITYNETETVGGAETATGTYHLIVDDESVAASSNPEFNDAPGTSPWAAAAVYAVGYDAVYETTQLRYNASVRVAPGEADD